MIDIYKAVEFHQIRQADMIVGASWEPKGYVALAAKPKPTDGASLRRGNLSMTVSLTNINFSTISMHIKSDNKTIIKTCTKATGGGVGCTVVFEGVDVCQLVGNDVQIGIDRNDRIQMVSTRFMADYVITKWNFITKLMQRPGREIVRDNVLRSSVCA